MGKLSIGSYLAQHEIESRGHNTTNEDSPASPTEIPFSKKQIKALQKLFSQEVSNLLKELFVGDAGLSLEPDLWNKGNFLTSLRRKDVEFLDC